jgi:Ras-related protein Rap-2C
VAHVPAILEILDTAGTEQFASMRDLYIKNGQGFIIVFSLTSRQSFEDVKSIREQILRVKGYDEVPIVLAANKCDLCEVENREVTTEEGCQLANEWMVPYIETTAKNSIIVNNLFTEIVKEMNFQYISNTDKKRKSKTKKSKLNSHKK